MLPILFIEIIKTDNLQSKLYQIHNARNETIKMMTTEPRRICEKRMSDIWFEHLKAVRSRGGKIDENFNLHKINNRLAAMDNGLEYEDSSPDEIIQEIKTGRSECLSSTKILTCQIAYICIEERLDDPASIFIRDEIKNGNLVDKKKSKLSGEKGFGTFTKRIDRERNVNGDFFLVEKASSKEPVTPPATPGVFGKIVEFFSPKK